MGGQAFSRSEGPPLVDRGHDEVPEEQVAERRRDDEVRHPLQRLRYLSREHFPGPLALPREFRKLGSGHGEPEERDRQDVQDLCVPEDRHRPRCEKAGQLELHQRAQVHDPPCRHHGNEVADRLAYAGHSQIEGGAEIPKPSRQKRELNTQLQDPAHESSPPQRHDQIVRFEDPDPAERNHGGDHGRVPKHGSHVGHEETAMAVEDAEGPCGEHQHPGHGKENAHQPDGEVTGRPFVARREYRNDQWRQGNPEQGEQPRDRRQDPEGDPGEASRAFELATLQEFGVDGYEGRAEGALSSRFCSTLGMRSAALHASAKTVAPKK